jgi:hypothetical protein
MSFLPQGHGQVPGLLGDPGRVRVRRRSSQVASPHPELDPREHVQGLSRIVSTVRKSQARIPAAWERRNSLHVGLPLGAGPRPELRSTVAIVVAETLMSTFRSSPRIRM